VGFEQKTNHESEKSEIKCSPGKVVMSCGMNMKENCQAEPFWNVYPSASDTCHCYDYGCDDCYATCVDASAADVVITTAHGSGVVQASCPSGYKVTGCGIRNSFDKHENWPDVYPSSESACTCYNYFGSTCHATCSKNIGNYQIVNQYGHSVDVKCPGQTFALGCGMREQKKSGDSEAWPGFWPTDYQTCHCYNYFGTTCYAICGTITNGSTILNNMLADASDIVV
jgi:hypothetical protein